MKRNISSSRRAGLDLSGSEQRQCGPSPDLADGAQNNFFKELAVLETAHPGT
jgi:hypothetical protein